MKLNIEDREVNSKDISGFDTAWAIEDADLLIEYYKRNNKIILGGDILTDKMDYSYDNWYYNVDSSIGLQENINRSVEKAHEYISKYIKTNGIAFYVVIVIT